MQFELSHDDDYTGFICKYVKHFIRTVMYGLGYCFKLIYWNKLYAITLFCKINVQHGTMNK